MLVRRRIQQAAWILYAASCLVHVMALATGHALVGVWAQSASAPLLAIAVITADPRRPSAFGLAAALMFREELSEVDERGRRLPFRVQSVRILTLAALAAATVGNAAGLIAPEGPRGLTITALFTAVLLYTAMLVPLWLATADALRLLLALPYGAVVVGLIALASGRNDELMPLATTYVIAIGLCAYLGSGVNALTWMGGTLLLLASSAMGMQWFLPGAVVPGSDLLVIVAYYAGQGLIVAGLMATFPVLCRHERRRQRAARDQAENRRAGAYLIVSE